MKLEKYEDKIKKKRKTILISIVVIVLISVSFLLYKTFAYFTENAEFHFMEGKVDYFGNADVYFVFYEGDEKLKEIPKKDSGLFFHYAECTNGATIEWDRKNWEPFVGNLNMGKTKCELYFGEDFATSLAKCGNNGKNVATCMKENFITEPLDLEFDDTNDNNIRYIGAIPNNYIDIGDRTNDGEPILWRIIGVMNNITNLDNGGRQESLVKIIRADSIGSYSWDSSDSKSNGGYGINEWSQADVMKLINKKDIYLDESTIGASLYWNREAGKCYSGTSNNNSDCDFTTNGLSEDVKDKFAKVRWNTGATLTSLARKMYVAERESATGRKCKSGTYCTDTVDRTTTWDGYLALMYPSDYGYAVGGEVRDDCLTVSLSEYSYNSNDCYNNDWLYDSSTAQWTLTPENNSSSAGKAFKITNKGAIDTSFSNSTGAIRPVGYLKSNIKITGGNGKKDNPYTIS